MFRDLFTGWHLIIVLVVIVLLFGATRLPIFAKSLGQSMRIFRREVKNFNKDDDEAGNEAAAESKTTTPDDKK
ncbi:MAG TPA: twin-arginine translocase TatA/TatE family subunit [Gryllotalpicola sp.]